MRETPKAISLILPQDLNSFLKDEILLCIQNLLVWSKMVNRCLRQVQEYSA